MAHQDEGRGSTFLYGVTVAALAIVLVGSAAFLTLRVAPGPAVNSTPTPRPVGTLPHTAPATATVLADARLEAVERLTANPGPFRSGSASPSFRATADALFPHGTPLRDRLSAVEHLSDAFAVNIERKWSGYAVVPFRSETYPLVRTGDQFVGVGVVGAEGTPGRKGSRSGTVSVPATVMVTILERLAVVGVAERPYAPRISWTDDNPDTRIRISITGWNDSVQFFTTSQGPSNVPWGVSHNGRTFVVSTDDVGRGLQELEPYLMRPALQEVVRDLEQQRRDDPDRG